MGQFALFLNAAHSTYLKYSWGGGGRGWFLFDGARCLAAITLLHKESRNRADLAAS